MSQSAEGVFTGKMNFQNCKLHAEWVRNGKTGEQGSRGQRTDCKEGEPMLRGVTGGSEGAQ